MNKVELAEKVAEKIGVTKKQAEDMLNAFEEVVTSTLKEGSEVTLTGFGTFMAKRREARMGVNPQKPGEKIQIPAVTVPKFKAGKSLKDALKMSGAPATPATPTAPSAPVTPAM
ncbi:MAG: HU family DNA-binding protein [Patescibacteria group bacterium]